MPLAALESYLYSHRGFYYGNLEMRRRAVIRLSFRSERHLKTVLDALKAETRRSPSSRSRIKVEEEEGNLIVSFEAKDTSALRAAMNAYLRWISLTQNILESVNNLVIKKDDK